jgi:hypothetical protein
MVHEIQHDGVYWCASLRDYELNNLGIGVFLASMGFRYSVKLLEASVIECYLAQCDDFIEEAH